MYIVNLFKDNTVSITNEKDIEAVSNYEVQGNIYSSNMLYVLKEIFSKNNLGYYQNQLAEGTIKSPIKFYIKIYNIKKNKYSMDNLSKEQLAKRTTALEKIKYLYEISTNIYDIDLKNNKEKYPRNFYGMYLVKLLLRNTFKSYIFTVFDMSKKQYLNYYKYPINIDKWCCDKKIYDFTDSPAPEKAQKLAIRLYNTFNNRIDIDKIFYYTRTELSHIETSLDYYLSFLNDICKILDTNQYTNIHTFIKFYDLLYNYKYIKDIESFRDYCLSLPYAQGITSFSAISEILWQLNSLKIIKPGSMPNNINELFYNSFNHLVKIGNAYTLKTKSKSLIINNISFTNLYYDSSIVAVRNKYIESAYKFHMDIYTLKDKCADFNCILKFINFAINSNKKYSKTYDFFVDHFNFDVDFTRKESCIFTMNDKKISFSEIGKNYYQISNCFANLMSKYALKNVSWEKLFTYKGYEVLYKSPYAFLCNLDNGKYHNFQETNIKNIFPLLTKQDLNYLKNKHEKFVEEHGSNFVNGLRDRKGYIVCVEYDYKQFNCTFKTYVDVIYSLLNENEELDFHPTSLFKVYHYGYTFKKLGSYYLKMIKKYPKIDSRTLINIIDDYNESCTKLLNIENNENNKYNLYPDNLITMHNRVTFYASQKKNDIMKKAFEKHSNLNKVYEFAPKNSEFVIISPKEPVDLRNEGFALSHCVGTYVQKYSEGKSKIFFMRKKDAINQSYVTLELNADNIYIQGHGCNDRELTDKEMEFVNSWLDFVQAYDKKNKKEVV